LEFSQVRIHRSVQAFGFSQSLVVMIEIEILWLPRRTGTGIKCAVAKCIPDKLVYTPRVLGRTPEIVKPGQFRSPERPRRVDLFTFRGGRSAVEFLDSINLLRRHTPGPLAVGTAQFGRV